LVKKYEDQWECECPALIPDGEDGTLLLLESQTVCECSGVCDQRMSFVHKGTKNKRLCELGDGASVKHYFTQCRDCNSVNVS